MEEININGAFISDILSWFITAGFIMWGWNVFASHFNLPTFTYWEVFAMRMAFSSIMKIFWFGYHYNYDREEK